jgi:hypothetical protein
MSANPHVPQAPRQPIAPSVYRPHAAPKVLQTKRSASQSIQTAKTPHQPVAPPVFRPQALSKTVASYSTLQRKQLFPLPIRINVVQMYTLCPSCGWGHHGAAVTCDRCGANLPGPAPAPIGGGGGGAALPAVAAPVIVHPLYAEVQITDDDEGATKNAKRAHNHFVRRLHEIGQANGFRAPRPAAAVAAAVLAITTSMGGGGGDHGKGCKEKVLQVVIDANQSGYDINDTAVQDALESIANALGSLGGTQIGNFRGTWRGGGFS